MCKLGYKLVTDLIFILIKSNPYIFILHEKLTTFISFDYVRVPAKYKWCVTDIKYVLIFFYFHPSSLMGPSDPNGILTLCKAHQEHHMVVL